MALPLLQSEIVVALFPFASRSFLANNLCFKVKVSRYVCNYTVSYGWTRLEIEPMIYRNRGKQADHYTTDVVYIEKLKRDNSLDTKRKLKLAAKSHFFRFSETFKAFHTRI
jgi:hypothetical protein